MSGVFVSADFTSYECLTRKENQSVKGVSGSQGAVLTKHLSWCPERPEVLWIEANILLTPFRVSDVKISKRFLKTFTIYYPFLLNE